MIHGMNARMFGNSYILYFLTFILYFLMICRSSVRNHISTETERLAYITPFKYGNQYIMFWRPQKVGSSTLLTILVSHGYRYNFIPRFHAKIDNFCMKIKKCAYNNPKTRLSSEIRQIMSIQLTKLYGNPKMDPFHSSEIVEEEKLTERVYYHSSVNHELCNMEAFMIKDNLLCAFRSRQNMYDFRNESIDRVDEIFITRDPLSRMISVYYFWGELGKLKNELKMVRKSSKTEHKPSQVEKKSSQRLGKTNMITGSVQVRNYIYHGNESTVPSEDIALKYAYAFPLLYGMPGPSYTFTSFSNNPVDAVKIIESNRMVTVVTERLDESLVVLSYYLGWSLADMVIVTHRKALSSHPRHQDWPSKAIEIMKEKIESSGEMSIYRQSQRSLDKRIELLKKKGIDFDQQLNLLRELRSRVTELCLSEKMLEKYRNHLEKDGLSAHYSQNRLRDVEDKYSSYLFSMNGEMLTAYDVCGNCEAHAILIALKVGLATSVSSAPTLEALPSTHWLGNDDFRKCPR